MSIYLKDVPLPEARSRLENALKQESLWKILRVETIPLDEHAIGRVLAKPVWAKISAPNYHAAAMDGFAVISRRTAGARSINPIILPTNEHVIYLDTGEPLPLWADAVIPIENVEAIDENGNVANNIRKPAYIKIRSAVTPWNNVRPLGEDIVASQLVLTDGHVLRAVDLGAIAACGYGSIEVAAKPRVAILPTGDELVLPGKEVKAGDIIEFNSIVLAAQVNNWGGQATRFPFCRDDFEEIRQQVIQAAIDHDLILLNAGSSSGSEDYSASVIASLGEVLVHGVAIRPGHPVIIGLIDKGKHLTHEELKDINQDVQKDKSGKIPIIGVPGYPVSSALTNEIFVEPLIARWLGRQPVIADTINAILTKKITSPAGDDDYIRVNLGRVGGRILAAPLPRGAGVITSLVRADGILVLPRGTQGLPAGADINVNLYRKRGDIENTIFMIGSHDMTLDILAHHLNSYNRRLVSANVGSLGGLVALQRKESHLAGSHLFDPQTSEFNLSYIKEYLREIPIHVVGFVGRTQGLLVSRGNPMQIQTLKDLTHPEVRFVNRQRGAGTRVLLDYHLGLHGINGRSIQGYEQEEYTHLAVAVAIASGRADCGLGIAAAAHALELDFIPLFDERYDLVIPSDYYQSDLLQPLFIVLNSDAFRREVSELAGYNTSPMGKLIAELRPSQG